MVKFCRRRVKPTPTCYSHNTQAAIKPCCFVRYNVGISHKYTAQVHGDLLCSIFPQLFVFHQ